MDVPFQRPSRITQAQPDPSQMKKPIIKSTAGTVQIFCNYHKLVKPETLKPNPDNPNKHTPKQLKVFEKIFLGNGFRRPITVSNQSGKVVKGHGALLAALKME